MNKKLFGKMAENSFWITMLIIGAAIIIPALMDGGMSLAKTAQNMERLGRIVPILAAGVWTAVAIKLTVEYHIPGDGQARRQTEVRSGIPWLLLAAALITAGAGLPLAVNTLLRP